ncbi:hypothetical protein [Streptococcus agalactiae]|uniref:hypothetical protein n=1 Tax=Streptococcus agalactiae TaxID=1311 RepID=UPI0002BA6164|nr:hypothetical protein [Streptococcus agalactiae]EPT37235.1 hypothetical protein SAG0024_01050 [Streptococcus agalactiae FSL C1-494]EPT43348.1 hypothetical protein SAG0034_01470 [Streptococcus agalactiae FSL S3-170]EPV86513.1 hypothetical protein SAG0007_10135 [Streptococcus agalactiae FSL C1-487]KLL29994.1 hypothetical protein WA02_10970 [Streptococcus agalactiae]KLL82754.1 hypothetical protein WA05_07795 [Streptococcus agalactiae]
MIDRSYLPFRSAREHQDRGMMKWMGFFLSEHTTSLGEERHTVNFSDELTLLDKLTLISQLYAGQLKGHFDIKHDNQKVTYQGQVTEISKNEIVVKSDEQFHLIKVENILAIQLVEGGEANE